MILYYFEHPSQLMKVLIHKLYSHKEEAIFMVSDFSYEFEPVKLLREHYMNSCNIVKMISFPHSFNWIWNADEEVHKKRIFDTYNELFLKNNFSMDDVDKIYISRDSGVGLETYCLMTGHPYTYFETIEGNAAKHIGNDAKGMHSLYNKMLTDNREKKLLVEVISTASRFVKHQYTEVWKSFDYVKAFQMLEEEKKNIFFSIYETQKINMPEKCNIFFPNSNYNIRVTRNMPIKYAYLANELLIDYYFRNEEVILKPHPLFDFDLIAKDRKISKIPYTIPTEMLQFIPGFKGDKAIIIASSSVYDIKGCANEIISFGWNYNAFFLYLHRFYVMVNAIEFLKEKETNQQLEISYNGDFGDQMILFERFVLAGHNGTNISVKCIEDLKLQNTMIIDWGGNRTQVDKEKICQMLGEIPNNAIVGFIGKDDNLPFVSMEYKDLLQFVFPIVIRKKQMRMSVHSDLDNEVIYIFCKNKELRDKLDLFRFDDRELACAGLVISADGGSSFDKQIISLQMNMMLLNEENEKLKEELTSQKENYKNSVNSLRKILEEELLMLPNVDH